MSDIFDEPPDENEAFENLDEALDDEDAVGGEAGGGPEGARDLDSQLIVDRAELEEIGADLDDPEQMSILDGGMDDPDGSGPPPGPRGDDDTAGWDIDPVTAADGEGAAGAQNDVGADGDAISDNVLDDVPELDDPELELIDEDPSELDRIADDAPGADSARW
jgi:hypothetical protein